MAVKINALWITIVRQTNPCMNTFVFVFDLHLWKEMHCEYVWGVGMNTFTNDKFARSNLRSNFFCAHLFARYAGFYHTTDAERYYKVINDVVLRGLTWSLWTCVSIYLMNVRNSVTWITIYCPLIFLHNKHKNYPRNWGGTLLWRKKMVLRDGWRKPWSKISLCQVKQAGLTIGMKMRCRKVDSPPSVSSFHHRQHWVLNILYIEPIYI